MQVIFEDNHLIAVNKPAGILVHGDETGDETLTDWVKEYIKIRYEKPGDVYLATLHRIDRPCSGVVVFARTTKAASRMSEYFKNDKIKKTYLAICRQRPQELEETLTHYLLKNHENNTVKVFSKEKKGAKKAVLHYQYCGSVNRETLLKIDLMTGRPHQIRAQLSKIGSPVNGDLKYGSSIMTIDKSVTLHCRRMEFIHPVTKEPVSIEAELPNTFPWTDFDDLVAQEKM